MEALSRQEYPAMLERLQPAGAVAKLNERVKRIGKVNSEIADWLSERRKVEEAYVVGLRKLAKRPLQEVGGDLGIFDSPWRKIVAATEEIAKSHSVLADRIEKDVENPLRSFSTTNREMSAMTTIQGNLAAMAKDVESAQERSDKLGKKAGKASAQKVDAATSHLQSASQQWDSQAPFVFETLQSLDETRLNHLRDVLTQYETHEADQVERNRKTIEETLGALLELDTAAEIRNWSQASVAGKPITERKARQLSNAGSGSAANSHMPPPATPRSSHTDNQSQHSTRQEKEKDSGESSKLKSRFGTMLGRRRQSIHGAFARAPSPNKGFVPFGSRSNTSRDGRPSPSPRASSNNLRESPTRDNRLSSLAESPPSVSPTSQTNGNANSTNIDSSFNDAVPARSSSNATNGTASAALADLSDVRPPPGPPPSHLKAVPEARRDSEGFTVPAAVNDPISQAEQDAAPDNDQPQFKLDIRNEPIQEQDADAQAALSNVANTLRSSQMVTPNRKAGTVRGRRDVRNTVYVPAANSLDVSHSDNPMPPSPGIAIGRAAALAALSSGEHPPRGSSDTTSIRSGYSLVNNASVKHAEMHNPGLNASIIETVSTTFENGEVKSTKIIGEIALAHNKVGDELVPASTHETIRINNFPNLEAIGPNRTFINLVSGEKPDEFTIDLSPISSKSAVAFTYRVHTDNTTLSTQGPLLLKAAWKPQGDKLALVLEYSLNPATSVKPVTFNNLVLVAIYGGARAVGCQTKPTGTHIKEKSLVYWRLGDVTLTQEWHKIIARFVGAEGATPEPGHIEARWEIQGSYQIGSRISLSRLTNNKGKENEEDDPFADDTIAPATLGQWVDVETSKKFVSGKYEAAGKNV